MKLGIRNAIWRSRASAIIGFLIIFFVIFPGLPAALKSTLFVVFGFLVLVFGLAGGRHKSYSDPEAVTPTEQETFPAENVVPEETPVDEARVETVIIDETEETEE